MASENENTKKLELEQSSDAIVIFAYTRIAYIIKYMKNLNQLR